MTVLKCGAERVTISDAEYDVTICDFLKSFIHFSLKALKLCETNVAKNVSDEYEKRKVDFLVIFIR